MGVLHNVRPGGGSEGDRNHLGTDPIQGVPLTGETPRTRDSGSKMGLNGTEGPVSDKEKVNV